ncbi:YraN family protein [Aliiruegeria lutimaris]|uniref:UPF0102 protein SAMN04488026_102650 n=1 Tax=Aliiruegeria lutimaris TaxID=571298 RepID=A0A1G8XIG7_9RHOB|nr:YraN family protein [Aliiruegeria lutimaris]SDJ90256.1 putative endonuclease [Aliiruegeria lutimaris]
MTGARSYHAGLAAEQIVARYYRERGLVLREQRWRGAAGEVDVIFAEGAGLVFVEVKASDNFESAAAHLGPRQMERIYAAAGEYLGQMPLGQATETRFDVALVDGAGRVEILEAAFGL